MLGKGLKGCKIRLHLFTSVAVITTVQSSNEKHGDRLVSSTRRDDTGRLRDRLVIVQGFLVD